MGLPSGSAVIAAVRSCWGRDRSAILRSYTIVGVLVTLFSLSLLVLALPTWIAQTTGTSATLMLAQGLLFLLGLGVVAAVLAPILLAHRRFPTPGEHWRFESLYGGLGYLEIIALYMAMIISAPPDTLGDVPTLLEPVVEALNALDPVLSIVPPVGVLALLYYLDYRIAN